MFEQTADTRIIMLTSKCTTTSKSMQASMFSFYIQYLSIRILYIGKLVFYTQSTITVISLSGWTSLSIYIHIYIQQNNHQICFTTYRTKWWWTEYCQLTQFSNITWCKLLHWIGQKKKRFYWSPVRMHLPCLQKPLSYQGQSLILFSGSMCRNGQSLLLHWPAK